MFPGQTGPFGPKNDGGSGAPGGPGGFGGPGTPPSADAMFESFLNEEDALVDPPESGERENQILAAGLRFFEKIKKMK